MAVTEAAQGPAAVTEAAQGLAAATEVEALPAQAEAVSPEAAAEAVPVEVAEVEAEASADKQKRWSDDRLFLFSILCLVGSEHVLRIEQFVQLLLSQKTVFQHQIVNTLTALQSLFGYLRRSLVSYNRIEGSDNTD